MIRVIIADDYEAIQHAMERLIQTADDMELVATATSFEAARRVVHEVPHDVIVLNDYLPPMRSPEAIRRFRADGVESAIVVVSMHEDGDVAVEALKEGANGYVLKGNFMEEFLDAIRDAADGKKFGSPQVIAKMRELLGDALEELLGG